MRLALTMTVICAAALAGCQTAGDPAGTASASTASRTPGTLSGQCQRLVIGGNDLTNACQPRVTRTDPAPGRVRLAFPIIDVATISITGRDLPNPTPDTNAIAIDQVTMTLAKEGVPPASQQATGQCVFANPYAGRMTIRCTGSQNNQPIDVVFRTDGGTPRR